MWRWWSWGKRGLLPVCLLAIEEREMMFGDKKSTTGKEKDLGVLYKGG